MVLQVSVVHVVSVTTGRLLVLRRDDAQVKYPGHWESPGGKGLPGETPVDAGVRELLEESGIAAVSTILRPLGVIQHPGVAVHHFLLLVATELPVELEEPVHNDHTWIDRAQLARGDVYLEPVLPYNLSHMHTALDWAATHRGGHV